MNCIGTYDGTIFYNPANKFCIVSVKTADQSVPAEARSNRRYKDHLIRFTAVGYEIPRTDAVELELDGEWTKGKYGVQLQVEQWREIVPRTKNGVEGYLASGLIKGIGPKTAADIVERFGVDTLDILEHQPERLLEIRGITESKLEDIKASYAENRMLQGIMTLPVPPVGTDTVPVSAASVSAGETALADAEEEPADEVAPAGEEKSAEEGNSAQPPAAEDEEKKRAEHEAAEAQRKAEFDAKQQAKKAAEQEQIARLEAMSDEEVIAASTQRVSTDVEKLTRRNMKECVSEHIQMLCMEDTAFARLTMHPKKNMIRCFQYINRKAWDYVQDELKASGTRPGPGQQTYGCDVPDDMCYQWAEDYFRDPDAKEDHEDEEKFVPKPYAGKSSAKSKPKKAAEKKKTEPKAAPKQEEKKPSQDGQMSLLDFGMAKAG